MARHSRRSFLQTSLVGAAGLALAGPRASARVLGANDRIRVAVAGLNGRGSAHVDEYAGMKDVEVAYLVDPDKRTWGPKVDRVKSLAGNTPQTVQDIRVALDDPNVDCVSIATPNHWHALMTIWACEAGKDVYVEKPCSHNVHEGRVAVEAARKNDRIVQHGTQSRSSASWAGAMEMIHSGRLGKLLLARALCYKSRGSIGFKPEATPPEELDFNIWLGPAPQQPYHGNLVHYNWHWFWDTGNGDIGNQGVHQMDVARWGIKDATLPQRVYSLGGRFGYEDQGETPNTQIALMEFGDVPLLFEVRGLKTKKLQDLTVGNIFYCEDGMIAGDGGGAVFFPKGSDKSERIPAGAVNAGGPFGSFIAALRSRKREELNAEILEGHYSSALCHLANVSYRLGKEAPFNPRSGELGDDKNVLEALGRVEEHLRDDNGVQLQGLKCRLGRTLAVDVATESIVGDNDANGLLTRQYREPFVVPDRLA